jgi:hypothetical protein
MIFGIGWGLLFPHRRDSNDVLFICHFSWLFSAEINNIFAGCFCIFYFLFFSKKTRIISTLTHSAFLLTKKSLPQYAGGSTN